MLDYNQKGYVNAADMLRIANVKNETLGLRDANSKQGKRNIDLKLSSPEPTGNKSPSK